MQEKFAFRGISNLDGQTGCGSDHFLKSRSGTYQITRIRFIAPAVQYPETKQLLPPDPDPYMHICWIRFILYSGSRSPTMLG